jgi:peroxiredoxin Q/BCP
MGLKPGTKIPEFTLPDQDGLRFSSAQIVGKKPLVVFFYPKDHTPGCTREACAFRDNYEAFQELGAEVVGISSDSQRSHEKFAASYRLPFRLLTDENQKVRRLFKVKGTFFNLLPGRETFVIDSKGVIRMAFNSMAPAEHMKQALKALKDAQIT